MGTTDLGRGARRVLAAASRGRVVSVYRRAAYLRFPGGLVALVSGGAPAGPVHLRCTLLPPVREGDEVATDGSRLAGRDWALRCDGPVWEGELPDPADLCSRHLPEPAPADTVAGADLLAPLLRAGRLEEVAALLGGRGEGLTPAGDDLVAGVLVVARLRWGPAAQERLLAVAGAVETTEVAGAFLAWAARGQCIAPVHDLLVALAAGDGTAGDRALRRLRAIGASSGRHLAAGLALGLAQIPRVESHTARAATSPGLVQRAYRSTG